MKLNYKFITSAFLVFILTSFILINMDFYNENITYENVNVCNKSNKTERNDCSLEYLNDKCKSYILIEYDTGKVISKYNEIEKLQIASMVKIMSASIVFDKINNKELSLEDDVTISDKASKIEGSKILLDSGSVHKVKDLLKTVIVCSANDSVIALSEKICGSEENFVKLMNDKAEKLGLKNTKFVNATGLPMENQYSCAQDVSIMLKNLMQNKLYFDFCKIWLEDYIHPSGRKTSMTNTNKLIRYYKGCDAGKTGYTSVAKHCLAASACRNNTRFIAVCIAGNSSKERFFTVSELFNYGFSNYSNRIIFNKGQKVAEIKITGAGEKLIPVYAKDNITIFGKNNEKIDYTYEVIPIKNKAPIKKYTSCAKLMIKVHDSIYKFDLIVNEDVKKQNYIEVLNDIFAYW